MAPYGAIFAFGSRCRRRGDDPRAPRAALPPASGACRRPSSLVPPRPCLASASRRRPSSSRAPRGPSPACGARRWPSSRRCWLLFLRFNFLSLRWLTLQSLRAAGPNTTVASSCHPRTRPLRHHVLHAQRGHHAQHPHCSYYDRTKPRPPRAPRLQRIRGSRRVGGPQPATPKAPTVSLWQHRRRQRCRYGHPFSQPARPARPVSLASPVR
jgi:hypothetical protein